MDVPQKLITGKYHIGLKLLPFLGLLMFLPSAFVLLGSQMFNFTLEADAQAAFTKMAVAGLGLFLAILAVNILLLWNERHGIRQLFVDVWASWEQYADEKSWQRFVKEQNEKSSPRFRRIDLFIITIFALMVVLSTVAVAGGMSPVALFLVAGVFLTVILAFVTKFWLERSAFSRARRRREGAPPPKVYIGKWGLYDEDEGYTALGRARSTGRLSSVEFKPPSEKSSRWGNVAFRVHYSGAARNTPTTSETIRVKVPPDKEDEAKALVERFYAERRLRR